MRHGLLVGVGDHGVTIANAKTDGKPLVDYLAIYMAPRVTQHQTSAANLAGAGTGHHRRDLDLYHDVHRPEIQSGR
jgi:hypothetical protein